MANGRGRELREALAAATGVPVVFTESPRGTADPALGALPDLLPEADLVVLLGRKLDFALRLGRPPAFDARCRFIHVDSDMEALRRSAAAIGDPERMLMGALADTLSAAQSLIEHARRGFSGAPTLRKWAEAVQRALDYRPAEWARAESCAGAVHPASVALAAGRALASRPEAVFVGDGGEFGQWAMACATAASRISNGPGGGIGGSIPYAIAARLARPDATVIATLGDGSFGFYLAEFETAARLRAPFVAVLGNDARWNAEHQIQLRAYGEARAHGCELLPVRYDLAVAALGGHGEHVLRAEDLDGAIERAIASGKPACVNVAIAPLAAPVLSRNSVPPGGAH
jgi:acetolactate synthase-1/2/3 large subunit